MTSMHRPLYLFKHRAESFQTGLDEPGQAMVSSTLLIAATRGLGALHPTPQIET